MQCIVNFETTWKSLEAYVEELMKDPKSQMFQAWLGKTSLVRAAAE